SDQGPARPFWRSFFTAPGQEQPADESLGFVRRLLAAAYREPADELADLHRAGFRVLPQEAGASPFGDEGLLPSWTTPFLWAEKRPLYGIRYVLTFRPFARLPPAVRRAYL